MTTNRTNSLDRPNLLARFINTYETTPLDNTMVSQLIQRNSDKLLLTIEGPNTERQDSSEQDIDKIVKFLKESSNEEESNEFQLHLLEIYKPLIEAIVDNLILNPADRDDLVQIGRITILNCIENYQTGRSFTNYTFRAMFNAISRAQIHSNTEFQTNYKPIPRDNILERIVEPNQEKQIEEPDLKEIIHEALLTLEKNRMLIIMLYFGIKLEKADIEHLLESLNINKEFWERIINLQEGETLNQTEIGKIFDCTRVNIGRIVSETLEALKTRNVRSTSFTSIGHLMDIYPNPSIS